MSTIIHNGNITLNGKGSWEKSFTENEPFEWDVFLYPRMDFSDTYKCKVELFHGSLCIRKQTLSMYGGQIRREINQAAIDLRGNSFRVKITNMQGDRETIRAHILKKDLVFEGVVSMEPILPFIEGIGSGMSFTIASGRNATVFDLGTLMDPVTMTIGALGFKVLGKQFDVEVRSIRSEDVTLSLNNFTPLYANGYLRLGVEFEGRGTEIVGDINVNMEDISLSVLLGLTVENGKITYDRNLIGVNFDCSFPNLGIKFLNGLFGVKNKIRDNVSSQLKKELRKSSNKTSISNSLNVFLNTLLINPQINGNYTLLSAKVVGNSLHYSYTQ